MLKVFACISGEHDLWLVMGPGVQPVEADLISARDAQGYLISKPQSIRHFDRTILAVPPDSLCLAA